MTTILAKSLFLRGGLQQSLKSTGKNVLSNSIARRTLSDLVDIDHFTSGWNLTDLDGYKPGKYKVKTYNKISPKVCAFIYLYYLYSSFSL